MYGGVQTGPTLITSCQVLSYCRATLFDRSLFGQALDFFQERNIGLHFLIYLEMSSSQNLMPESNSTFDHLSSKTQYVDDDQSSSLNQCKPGVYGSPQHQRSSSLASCHSRHQVNHVGKLMVFTILVHLSSNWKRRVEFFLQGCVC